MFALFVQMRIGAGTTARGGDWDWEWAEEMSFQSGRTSEQVGGAVICVRNYD